MKANGYGQYRTGATNYYAHRLAYEMFVGPVPDGHHVHHICENRLCVNPLHLVVLTPSEHWRIGNSPSARRARATHCQHGHEFTVENTYVSSRGHRSCRSCLRTYRRERSDPQKRRAQRGSVLPADRRERAATMPRCVKCGRWEGASHSC